MFAMAYKVLSTEYFVSISADCDRPPEAVRRLAWPTRTLAKAGQRELAAGLVERLRGRGNRFGELPGGLFRGPLASLH